MAMQARPEVEAAIEGPRAPRAVDFPSAVAIDGSI